MKGRSRLQLRRDSPAEPDDPGNVHARGRVPKMQHAHGLGVDEPYGASGVKGDYPLIHKFQQRLLFSQKFPQAQLLHDGVYGGPQHAARMGVERFAGRSDPEYPHHLSVPVVNRGGGTDEVVIFRAIVFRRKNFELLLFFQTGGQPHRPYILFPGNSASGADNIVRGQGTQDHALTRRQGNGAVGIGNKRIHLLHDALRAFKQKSVPLHLCGKFRGGKLAAAHPERIHSQRPAAQPGTVDKVTDDREIHLLAVLKFLPFLKYSFLSFEHGDAALHDGLQNARIPDLDILNIMHIFIQNLPRLMKMFFRAGSQPATCCISRIFSHVSPFCRKTVRPSLPILPHRRKT